MECAPEKTVRRTLTFGSQETVLRVLGPRDSFLRQVRDALDLRVVARGRQLTIEGPDRSVEACQKVLDAMRERIGKGGTLDSHVVEELLRSLAPSNGDDAADGPRGPGPTLSLAEGIAQARTHGQAAYIQAILENDIVFCTGPAGTGKTYLAVAAALDYLRRDRLKRVVLCRPAVEAGEHLGFLPGDMQAKVNPYLRPLYDALHDLMSLAQVRKYIDNDLIEILPLAFVRGRTLDHAFIILDEAQNCTIGQMKTFLTRLGATAKLVVTGDITQVDLPPDTESGLVDVHGRLDRIAGIRFVRLETCDIVRHRLVRDIVNAYQREPAAEAELPPRSRSQESGDA